VNESTIPHVDPLAEPSPFDINYLPRIRWGEYDGVPGRYRVEKLVPGQARESVRLVPVQIPSQPRKWKGNDS